MVEYLNNNSGFNQWNASRNADKKPSLLGGVFWWVLIFMAAWLLVSSWLSPNKNNTVPESADTTVAVDLSSVPTFDVKSDNIAGTVQGLRVSNIQLYDYKLSGGDNGNVALLSGDNAFVETGLVASGTTAPTIETKWKNTDGVLSWRNSDGVTFKRTVSSNNYIITIVDEVHNKTSRDISVAPYAKIMRENDMKSSAGVYTGSVVYANNKLDHQDWTRFNKKSFAYSTTNGFAGFVDQYWETVVSIDSPDQTISMKKYGDLYGADIKSGPVTIAGGETKSITTNIYVGPRDKNILADASSVIPGLNKSIDYGWFWFLSRPMVWALNVFDGFVGNYGIAIIILTLLVRLLMWSLTRKSYTSMAVMQKMQPEMERIQKLYPNDRQRQQMEMMRLYQANKTSPMSGCLPMLVQIPIFFALYKALLISVQMRNAEFLWISDLSVMDPYFILPILMGITMWLQQTLQTPSPKQSSDNPMAQTGKVMKWMPLLFTVMFAWMPAGLVLYWTVSNIFGIIQMYIIKSKTK